LDELSGLIGWMEADAGGGRQDFQVRPVLESLVELECHRAGEPLSIDLTVPAGVSVRDQRRFNAPSRISFVTPSDTPNGVSSSR
jgi:hypothetical protein